LSVEFIRQKGRAETSRNLFLSTRRKQMLFNKLATRSLFQHFSSGRGAEASRCERVGLLLARWVSIYTQTVHQTCADLQNDRVMYSKGFGTVFDEGATPSIDTLNLSVDNTKAHGDRPNVNQLKSSTRSCCRLISGGGAVVCCDASFSLPTSSFVDGFLSENVPS
jgi:hypothetical protein